jgi:hypothetical protein
MQPKLIAQCSPIASSMFVDRRRTMTAACAYLLCVGATFASPLPTVNDENDLPSSAERAVVYHRSPTAPCFADYVPSTAEVAAPWKIAMAGDEYEPMQIGLFVPSVQPGLRNVRIEIDCDLSHRIGRIYHQLDEPLPDVTDGNWVWREANRPDRGKPWAGKDAEMPQNVLPLHRIDAIRPGRSAAFWVTFKTDASTPPGPNAGKFRLTADNDFDRTIQFVVEVHPFTLPRPRVAYALYYWPYQAEPEFQGQRFQEMYLEDMAAHGCNALHVYVDYEQLSSPNYDLSSSSPHREFWTSPTSREYCNNYFTPEDYEPDGGYNVIKFIEAQIRMGRFAGLVQSDRPLIGGQSQWNISDKANLVAALRRFEAEFDWPTIALYTRDEPPPHVFAEVTEHITQFKKLGAHTTTAMYMNGAFDLGGVHDIWIMPAGEVTPHLIREARQQAAQVWSYNTKLRTNSAEASRYWAGLYTWVVGLDGNSPYAYMGEQGHQPHFDEKWRLSGRSVHGFVTPSAAGPVPSVGFEGWREGIDDYRYLQLLETRLAAAKGALPVARRWLADLRARALSPLFDPSEKWPAPWRTMGQWESDWVRPHPDMMPEDYDAIRARAARYIAQLAPMPDELNPEPDRVRRMPPRPLESETFADKSVEACIAALKTGTTKQKRQAAASLATRDPNQAKSANSALVELLRDRDTLIPALRALGRIGPHASEARGAIEALTSSPDAFIRKSAAVTLEQFD